MEIKHKEYNKFLATKQCVFSKEKQTTKTPHSLSTKFRRIQSQLFREIIPSSSLNAISASPLDQLSQRRGLITKSIQCCYLRVRVDLDVMILLQSICWSRCSYCQSCYCFTFFFEKIFLRKCSRRNAVLLLSRKLISDSKLFMLFIWYPFFILLSTLNMSHMIHILHNLFRKRRRLDRLRDDAEHECWHELRDLRGEG